MSRRFFWGMLVGVLVTVVIGAIYLLMVRPVYNTYTQALQELLQSRVQEADEGNGEEADTLLAAITRLDKRISVLEVAPTGSGPAVVLESEETVQLASASTASQGAWSITFYEGATDAMRGWIGELKNLDQANWPDFPNVDNSRVGFVAANGLEYAEDETGYCDQQETCDLVVPPLHYRIVTGDYNLPFDSCRAGEDDLGCGFMMVNVGNVSTGLEDISVDFGFTVWGRYWNGDEMDQAIWGGLSHVAHNMLDMESALNRGTQPNAGGNCGRPEGCSGVRLAFYIMSGNELLVQGVTTVGS